jgi:lipopolysaccharide/colanic/teichoic acid biosynthesis glycosyltransferase
MQEINYLKMPMAKRILDIVLSALLIIIASPVFFIISFALYLERLALGDLRSSIFYVEKRISKGRPFNFVKFNIFKPGIIEDMKKNGVFIHTKPLERQKENVTRVGHIVQTTYMDELPQLFSILLGSISFVGPRPVNLEVYENLLKRGVYTKKVIKTGLTGPYQSHKGMQGKKSDIEMDRDYIEFCRNHGGLQIVVNDLKIILETFKVLFQAKGL